MKNTGHQKIDWVSKHMKLLNKIQNTSEYNLSGLKIGMSIHLEAKTAYLAITLKKLGAEVVVTGCNPLSTQDDVAEALKDFGVYVHAKRTESEKEYFSFLHMVLDYKPDLILDDGADLTVLAHTERKEVLENLKGVSEETTTGVRRLRNLQSNGILQVPVIAVNNAKMKFMFDNRYGTGQSTLDSIMRNTNLLIAGKNVLVAGYGWCGRGIAMRAHGLGAKVMVSEVDPIKAVEALMDGFEVGEIEKLAPKADFIITATGVKDVLNKEIINKLKDGVILANAGHFNVEIPMEEIEKMASEKYEIRQNVTCYRINNKDIFVIGKGRLVNLAAADGHPVEIMDISFALQTLSLIYLSKNYNKLERKVYDYPEELDKEVAQMRLETMGINIDKLTSEQEKYLREF
ncbi:MULTISPECIES: adenosylhomocysteinase [Fervidobacterium]|uniref:Adenosylhomocysteinase n=1 Tax=Fervidobacterium nodosum (strain ATCC 35602 / DSM 5306 / Rt17-B1) TaxID=381764 RepID=A7HJC0_FERNB|nr:MULTISPECIES: adenosylhomocysteinase [Fervidobacterium]ABS60003.1 adenosylhomocysteinase [Fervidobacterium nodosum Rt17-B1]KAF2961275.1 adenosylhomocysteinase [Fervidobacterium sp. 2310opik-2]PHJ14276.1 S-adenosyl-L-homocysteine hydrolase [Fervidobacterium sp. SC_NGM5_G05]